VSALPKSPRLRRILAAYTVNQLGTWFGTVALSVAVYDHTGSAAAVTALFLARFVPALAVPALVARVEASPRRGRLSAIYALEGVSAAGLAALVWQFWLPGILLLVALDGTGALAASALLRAEAARPEPQEATANADGAAESSAHDANAGLNLALSVCVVVGPTLAALAVKALGVPIALLIDAATFLACGALLIDLYPYVEEHTGTSVRARLGAAWQYLRETPSLRAVLLTEAAALIFFETGAPAEVIYAKGTLGAGDLGYGTLLSAWGVGMVLGSLLFARGSKRSLGAMLTVGTLAVGLAYIGFAAAPSLELAALAALVGGVGNGVQWASLIGTVQRLTPPHLHGRLMGTVESIGALCPLIGLPLSGLVLTLGSPRIAFLVFGLAAAGATAGFMRLWLGWRAEARTAAAHGATAAEKPTAMAGGVAARSRPTAPGEGRRAPGEGPRHGESGTPARSTDRSGSPSGGL
jgi:MFS family permease